MKALRRKSRLTWAPALLTLVLFCSTAFPDDYADVIVPDGIEPSAIVAHITKMGQAGKMGMAYDGNPLFSDGVMVAQPGRVVPSFQSGRYIFPAELNLGLQKQDEIATNSSWAEIQLHDRDGARDIGPTSFFLDGHTRIRLSRFDYDHKRLKPLSVIELIKGTLRNFLRNRNNPGEFQVRGGQTVVSLSDGEAEIEYDPDKDRLLVKLERGKVVVTSPYGSEILTRDKPNAMFIGGKYESGGPS